MTEVVTRLVIRADGSMAVLDQFEKKMVDAGKATDRSTGSVASFEARMAKARAAMEAGNRIATESVARRSAEQRAFDNLAASVDKSYGLRIRLEREAERASAAAANAVNMGYISQEQALSTLMALEQRHAAQLGQAAAANDNLAASYRSSAAAADAAAAASIRANAARRQSAGGANQAHTTNLLFQAQDIAMMTAMGQAPMMLAMQQGMQVGGIFHQMGSGKAIAQGLGSAIVGLLNPLNLATIAVIGLGAAGVQWFMSTLNKADDATDALKAHNASLDELLEGYHAVRDAAQTAFDAAIKLPQGVVASDLRATLREQEKALADVQRRIEGNRNALAETAEFLRQVQDIGRNGGGDPSGLDAGIRQIELMRQLAIDTSSTRAELDAAATAARELYNTSEDPALREMALQADELAKQLMAIQAQADSASAALNRIPRSIQISIAMSREFSSALGGMQDLYVDPRSRFDIAREDLKNRADQAMATAQSYGQITGAAKEYERVLSSINAAEAEANAKANAKGAKAAQKPFDQWNGNVDQFQQRIASQRLELELLGQSTYEIERQKSAFDLLNQAKQAGIPITSQVTDQINLMSAQYAAATIELQRQQAAQAQLIETYNFGKSTFGAFMSDFRRDLMSGTSLWESFGNAAGKALDSIADRALSMAANGLFDMIFGSLMGRVGGMGNSLGGGWGVAGGFGRPGIFGIPGFAEGTNYAPGGMAWVGERGPELVNLPRGSQVIPNGRSMAMAANGNGGGDIIIHNQINVPPGTSADVAPAIAREVTKELRRQLPDAIKTVQRNDLRRVG